VAGGTMPLTVDQGQVDQLEVLFAVVVVVTTVEVVVVFGRMTKNIEHDKNLHEQFLV
jgi:hypothetical protein